MGYDFDNGILAGIFPMKNILKNRIFASSLMFLLLSLAGGFVIMAPFLVILRNEFIRSSIALKLWPIISPEVIGDILLNRAESMAAYAVSALVILALYTLLWTLFSGGIYTVIVNNPKRKVDSPKGFLQYSVALWPGYLKLLIIAFIAYSIAIFLGATFGQILGRLWAFLRFAFPFLFFLMASTYLQILKNYMAFTGDISLKNCFRNTRGDISKSFMRLLVGNISAGVIGLLIFLLLFLLLKGVRGFEWNPFVAVLVIIIEQLIIFVICLIQAIRINFNHSIIQRGNQDVVGGTQLG
jgi:hypothetical protein